MVLDVLVLRKPPENEAEYLLELLFALGLHIASYMLSLLFQLPLEASVLFSRLINGKGHWVHIEMDGQLVLLSFFSFEFECVLFVIGLREGYGADLES